MRPLPILALLLAAAGPAAAQPAPFEMTPEDGGERAAPVAPPARVEPVPEPVQPPETRTVPARVPTAGEAARRYLLPVEHLSLSGEIAQRRWSFYLTPEEAAAANRLRFGYQNSILVAPEASTLRFLVNDSVVHSQPVASPDEVSDVEIDLPTGVLRAGSNTIAILTDLRHRTDCTIQSTYDLWVDIDAERTFLAFEAGADIRPKRLDDLRAVGLAENGATYLDIVVPAGQLADAARPLMRLAQGLALAANMPNQIVSVFAGELPPDRPGRLTVIAGPSAVLGELLPAGADSASGTFVELEDGRSALALTGADWGAVENAVERVVAPVDRPFAVLREALSNPGWRTPDAPLLTGARDLTLGELGVATQEFSGRRFRAEFALGIPADFYAEAYGEATMLLDAAYTGAVNPGSHLDIYVNGNIATTLPIGAAGGAVLRRYPVGVTMRHFRPGTNIVAIEAVIETDADAACLPGTTAGEESRFALFDSSVFRMPDFARISQRPNLAATQGTGFPYNRSTTPVPLVIGESTPETLGAAATFLARLAVAAGRPIQIELGASSASAAGRDALFVAPASRLPSGVPAQLGIADAFRTDWSGVPPEAAASSGTQASIDRWRNEIGFGWQQPFVAVEEWLNERFYLSLDALWLTRSADPEFAPPPSSTLMVAQGSDPTGEHVWTLVTAPNDDALTGGTGALSRYENWRQLGGRATVYDEGDESFIVAPAIDARLVPSQPTSFANLRLVVANWLSENVMFYALLLAFASLGLGVITAIFTSFLGRRR